MRLTVDDIYRINKEVEADNEMAEYFNMVAMIGEHEDAGDRG